MLIPNGFGQINWLFQGTAYPNGAQVTLGYDVPSGGGGPDEEAEFFYTVWRDNILPLQTVDLALVGCLVKHGPNSTGPTGLYVDNDPGDGSNAACAPNLALLVHKRTAAGGRTGRGRMFVPGLAEIEVDPGGVVSSGIVSAYQTAFDALQADMEAVFAFPSLLHDEDSPLTTPTQITAFAVQGLAATQRKRLRR